MSDPAAHGQQTEPPDTNELLGRLESQIADLGAEVRRLGIASTMPREPLDEPVAAGAYAWLGALDLPVRRRPQLPRLLLEGLFLAAAAAAAAIADLDAVAIAGVMVGAWVLVALIEWAASRADRRQELPLYAPAPPAPAGADPAWYAPPVEQTLLDAGAGDDQSVTGITRLPPPVDEVEATVEQRPAG
ncbi:MAG: hypothetical protein H0W16_08645 [Actinobacteria bacterium]|nr:hypothetical protein [Actinomycetota bacterium]